MVRSALRRFLSGPIQPSAVAAGSMSPAAFDVWIADFSPETIAACREWLAPPAPATWIVMPQEERLAAFRTDPAASLRAVRGLLGELAVRSDQAGRVLWCLENRDDLGLSRVEAEAVFGEALALDRIDEGRTRGARTKLLVAGRLRDEDVIVSVRLEGERWMAAQLSMLTIDWLDSQAAQHPHAIVFVDHPTALQILGPARWSLATRIRALARNGAATIGLWVPESRTHLALQDPEAEVAPLRQLGGAPVGHVRFERWEAIASPADVWPRLAAAGLAIDSSAPLSYLRGGAYWPQAFDVATPGGVVRGDVPLEIVAVPAVRRINQVWRWRTRSESDRLLSLIDFERVNAYGRDIAPQLRGAQTYHEYRVYNWPAAEPSPRVTLFDVGAASRPFAVMRATVWCRRQKNRRRIRLVKPSTFYESARLEADARIPATETSARRDQMASHTYLQAVASAELREDAVAFTRFISGSLGVALEIGSGYGQFARALADRAAKYICLELDPSALSVAVADSALRGVAADIHALPFRKQSFNAVIANNVLEHAYDPARSLAEISRVLTDDGRLFAFIPLDARNPDYALPAHYWKADEANIVRALAMGGLRVVRSEIANLYELGVRGAFPSCDGLTCQIEAAKA